MFICIYFHFFLFFGEGFSVCRLNYHFLLLRNHSEIMLKYAEYFKWLFFFFFIIDGQFDVAKMLISESLSTDAHLSRSSKLEEKDKEHKRDLDGAKEKERYREKYMGKSIQELDLSDCKRCTPSYRLLPADVYNFYLISFLVGFVNNVFCSCVTLSPHFL